MSDKAQNPVLRVRELEFDPRSNLIIVRGQRTFLDPRSSNVLSTLAERFGECVGKDELLRLGWPGQLVHENSLAKAISKLRRVIRGSGIEIVAAYGLGYILREARDVEVVKAPQPEASSVSRIPRGTRRNLGFLVGILLCASAGFYVLGRSDAESPIRQTRPITNDAPDAVATILWVDDHPSNNRLEVDEFRKRRIAVHLAESTDDALRLLAMNHYELVISDLGRGEDRLAGIRMIGAMKQRDIRVPVLIYTMRPEDPAGQAAQRKMVARAGASDLAVTPREVRDKVIGRFSPRILRPIG